MRRRYDMRFDQGPRKYVVEMRDEQGGQLDVEAFATWDSADHMRRELNARLEQTGELLPERRR